MGRAVENVKSCMHIMWNKKVFVCSLAWDDSIIFCLCHPNTQIFCFAQICLFSIVGVFLYIGNAIQQCIWLYSIFYIELYLYFEKTPGFGLLKPHYLWVSNVAVYYFVMWSAINWGLSTSISTTTLNFSFEKAVFYRFVERLHVIISAQNKQNCISIDWINKITLPMNMV